MSTPEPREQGKYLVIYKRPAGNRKRHRVEGDIKEMQPGDVVSFHDGCGHASAFVSHVALTASKVKTVPQVFNGYLLRPSMVLTFNRIIEVLRPNHESVKQPPPQRAVPVVIEPPSEEELERQRELAEAKKKAEARRQKKAAVYKKRQAEEAKVERKKAREARLAELKAASTMNAEPR